jgi:hypothetical protein
VGANGETERTGYFNKLSADLQSRIIGEKLISTKYHGRAMARDSHSGSQLSIGGKSTWCSY